MIIALLIDCNDLGPGTRDPGPGFSGFPLNGSASQKESKKDENPSGKRESMIHQAAEGIYCNKSKLRATPLPSEPRTH